MYSLILQLIAYLQDLLGTFHLLLGKLVNFNDYSIHMALLIIGGLPDGSSIYFFFYQSLIKFIA